MAASSAWGRRSGTRPRSSTRAGRSACASSAPSSTWSRARATSARDPREQPAQSHLVRLGVLGGTFNPPHLGHLVCAQEAYIHLELDRVMLIPAAMPPHKPVEEEPGP